jgi:proteasome accessory factor PafA2
MSIIKAAGIETEYGITLEGKKDFDSNQTSIFLLDNLDQSNRASWEDGRVGGAIKNTPTDFALNNGARLYVDHAHPEFSTAECIDLKDLIAFDKAGEIILDRARENANKKFSTQKNIQLYKNNSDQKGNSYGCHENYLIENSCYKDLFGNKMHKIFLYLVPFFVTRQVFCGAGKVGAENGTEHTDFQVSQRADFFETVIGLQTTYNRPIINTRDEPHADPSRFRRLHVICGDANMSEYSTFLKIGTTQVVLHMVEDDTINVNFILENPVSAIKSVSRDLNKGIRLENGKKMTAIEIQREYLYAAYKYFEKKDVDQTSKEVLQEWESVLDKLEENPMQLNRRIDWVIKKWLIQDQMRKKSVGWGSPVLREIDIRYHDIRRDAGIFYILQNEGLIDRVIKDQMIYSFILNPPVNTRAYFRGECIEKFSDQVVGVDWESIEFFSGEKIALPDPTRMTKNQVEDLLEASTTVSELLSNVSGLEA